MKSFFENFQSYILQLYEDTKKRVKSKIKTGGFNVDGVDTYTD